MKHRNPSILEAVRMVVLAAEAEAPARIGHLQFAQEPAAVLGKRLSLLPTDLDDLQTAALLQDVGGLALPEFTLHKLQRLSARQLENPKIYAASRAPILECAYVPETITTIVRAHHEQAGIQHLLRETDAVLIRVLEMRDEEHAIAQILEELGSSLSLSDTISRFSAHIAKLVPCQGLVLWNRKGQTLVPKILLGESIIGSNPPLPEGVGISECRYPVFAAPTIPTERQSVLPPSQDVCNLGSVISVSLAGSASDVGVLSLYHTQPKAFTTNHLRILSAVSSKLAVSIENALRFEQVQASARTDYLTHLPNLGSFLEHLERELARCRRTGEGLGVMVCDIDGFKQINDHFGHLAGNQTLQLFASALKGLWREYDYVARMGGDEFVVLAPRLTKEAAASKVNEIRQIAASVGKEVCGNEALGASAGVAFCPFDGTEPERLLTEADRRMYSAKRRFGLHCEAPAHRLPLGLRLFRRRPFDAVCEQREPDAALGPVGRNNPLHIDYRAKQPSV